MVQFTPFSPVPEFPEFDPGTIFNVSQNVGPSGWNVREDVMLVQFMLKVAGDGADWAKGLKPIEPDGYYGPITASWIKAFQEATDTEFASRVFVDYYVDPANESGVSTVKGTIYTIVFLNLAVFESDKDLYETMDTSHKTPIHLRFALMSARPPRPEPAPPGPNPLPPPPPPPIQ
jgi:hypothetical protein